LSHIADHLLAFPTRTVAGDAAGGSAPDQRAYRATEGAQSIRRAAAVLRLVAGNGGRGASLREVVKSSGLHKATAHRILRALFDEALLEQDPATRNYRLGVEVFALAAAMGEQFDIKTLAQPSLEALCRETDDTVYLSIRSGFDALCLDMHEGNFPTKTLRLHVRDRWPLGVGAFTVPLLAFLPDPEVAEIIRHNAPRLPDHEQYRPERLLDLVRATRNTGYAVNQILAYPTMCAVAVPVLDWQQRPIASLCVTAIISRMAPKRQARIVKRLLEESHKIAQLWHSARRVETPAANWRSLGPASAPVALAMASGHDKANRRPRIASQTRR
jgi:DNA-binding IclR family transcriptional regulator